MVSLSKYRQVKFSNFLYSVRPLVHMHNDTDTPTNVKYRKIFPVVAGLILLLALINYMSLATVRSAIRAKEIGVRKILGADRGNIVKQFTTPFQYQFLDDAFDGQHKAEDRLSNVFDVFTALTIFIACLGLFGLASFSAAQRTKEIGIRKVLAGGFCLPHSDLVVDLWDCRGRGDRDCAADGERAGGEGGDGESGELFAY
jgi:ABC-type antimicrobial peptide transport system permease subunit